VHDPLQLALALGLTVTFYTGATLAAVVLYAVLKR
jgi:hypothetical protein